MKAIRTRLELLEDLGPHKSGNEISISPMFAATLIRQGKAKIITDQPIQKAETSKVESEKIELKKEQLKHKPSKKR